MPYSAKSLFPSASALLPFLFMSSLSVPRTAISGLLAIGPMTMTTDTTGCQALGLKLLNPVTYGHPVSGVGSDGVFVFHEGYWGEHVGFYGGINYGYGYGGRGYEGGRWDNGHFFYNRSVNRVNETIIHNTYNTRIVENNTTRVSYNGGTGGIEARPTAQEETYNKERHVGRVAAQNEHIQQARSNPELRASNNQGKPPIAATAKPADFKSGVVPARQAGGAYKAPPPNTARNGNARPANEARSENRPPANSEARPENRPTTPEPKPNNHAE